MKAIILAVAFVVGLVGCQGDSKTDLLPMPTRSMKAKTFEPLCIKKDCQTEAQKAEAQKAEDK